MADVFLPNLDGDFVDVSGRREDGSGGSGRGRRTGLVFWRLAGGEVAPLLVPVVVSVSLVDIFLKEGVWSWFWNSGLTF